MLPWSWQPLMIHMPALRESQYQNGNHSGDEFTNHTKWPQGYWNFIQWHQGLQVLAVCETELNEMGIMQHKVPATPNPSTVSHFCTKCKVQQWWKFPSYTYTHVALVKCGI